jgi:hypothetical protein
VEVEVEVEVEVDVEVEVEVVHRPWRCIGGGGVSQMEVDFSLSGGAGR